MVTQTSLLRGWFNIFDDFSLCNDKKRGNKLAFLAYMFINLFGEMLIWLLISLNNNTFLYRSFFSFLLDDFNLWNVNE